MTNDKGRTGKDSRGAALGGPAAAVSERVVPLFRPIDWITFATTTLVVLVGYLLTLAPDLTLQDSGELAVGSMYAAVPHAPGYPIWTLYSWLFTVILPFSNIAWRVAVSSAVSAALASGLLGMLVSRGSSMILESIEDLRSIERRWENALCMVSGFAAAILLGFNGFMWSQAIIVEVYCLSVLSLMGVLICLLRWMYAPHQRWYLYGAFFLFGICFNNHQTLIVAAMGMEVAIAAAHPKLGRDLFLGNGIAYLLGLICKSLGIITSFDNNFPLYMIYNLVGIGSIVAFVYLAVQTKGILSEWKTVLVLLAAWLIGAAFYFYMPLTSATNPPMNWGYPRTFDGFIHAFTRGQYEKTNPTNLFTDPLKFVLQVKMYFEGAVEEFHVVLLLMAIVPFFFFRKMQQRERAWIIGNTAIYACLAFLLLILLNPQTDRQSRDLTKVFFTASHVTLAMFMGYGITLIGAMMSLHYQRIRTWTLYGSAVASAMALYHLVASVYSVYMDPRSEQTGVSLFFHGLGKVLSDGYFTAQNYSIYAALFLLLVCLLFMGAILVQRVRMNFYCVVAVFSLAPLYAPLSHLAENEQRGHLFGYWFGHDMFTPPYNLYPEMTKDAILFGGTDPGRFCPTYMIFAESFIKPEHRRDPKFDRRDVYIITQNALADGTYLNYIRAHYNRSTQIDPPFFRDMIGYFQNVALGKEEYEKKARGLPHKSNTLSKVIGSLTNVFNPVDSWILDMGSKVEARRRREGVYPPKEIQTPSVDDSQKAFQEYILDAQKRLYHDSQFPNEPKQIRPGELVSFAPDGRVQVAGQVAVMAINGLLTKVIFDENPDNEFFVEESFPLEWMYPYLTPFGIIMKINRQPVKEMTEEMLNRDHEFWSQYSERLLGKWITYDTPVKEICDFADRVYRSGDLTGYKGDPKFVRDNDAQKAFSKLRNSIAGLYAWRINDSKSPAERSRLIKEADFAFKQAFAFCPYSPETVSRYATLLAGQGRLDDAILVAETCGRLDTESLFTASLVDQLRQLKQGTMGINQLQSQMSQLELQYRTNTNNVQAAFNLVSAYLQVQRTGAAYQILDELVQRTNAEPTALLSVANAYAQLGQYGKVEPSLRRLLAFVPENPEVWYDLAAAQSALGKSQEAITSLRTALQLSNRRLAADPKAANLQATAAGDNRFASLRALPEFQKLVSAK